VLNVAVTALRPGPGWRYSHDALHAGLRLAVALGDVHSARRFGQMPFSRSLQQQSGVGHVVGRRRGKAGWHGKVEPAAVRIVVIPLTRLARAAILLRKAGRSGGGGGGGGGGGCGGYGGRHDRLLAGKLKLPTQVVKVSVR
jgi:hypothetical protein